MYDVFNVLWALDEKLKGMVMFSVCAEIPQSTNSIFFPFSPLIIFCWNVLEYFVKDSY